jgi:hypothetical protein
MADTIALCLVSHTNTGKTTLARTLLARDVGEVRDAAHVTIESAAYVVAETPAGDRLELWDTPGFGDSARLARRLAAHGDPIGWFLAEVWDRFRERPSWLAQKAVRSVRERADVVLYLVNATEVPRDAGYLQPELEILAWIGKPVVALLNQTGRPRPREEEAAEVDRWRDALQPHPLVRAVLPLDAFARCWVQEAVLLRAVREALPASREAVFDTLAGAWEAQRILQFDAAMDALARPIANAALDRVTLAGIGLRSAWQTVGRAVGLRKGEPDDAASQAMREMASRLDAAIRASTDALIAIHGLAGRAAQDVVTRLAANLTTSAPVHEGKAAVVGGVVSGALSGLVADLASGGVTFGAGMVAGGLLGALGGAGLARGYNVVRGTTSTEVRWSDAFLDSLVVGALLRYLAVAHYGRGRGDWTQSEHPAFWRDVAVREIEAHKADWVAMWRDSAGRDAAAYGPRVAAALRASAVAVLDALYPGAMPALARTTPRA